MLSANLSRGFRALVFLTLAATAGASTVALRGRLALPVDEEPLQLVTDKGVAVELVSDEGLERTMRDPQLAKRTWEVRGQLGEDGRMRVEKIFTVKDGDLYRVTYYCEICHITTHEPGLCMCCQGDTDLHEIKGE